MEIAVERQDLALLLIYSVRYACGRRTTAPSDTAAIVNAYAGRIRSVTPDSYGDRCDVETWTDLIRLLEKRVG